MDEATFRRIIREELDNYDRDKGITPRMSQSGVPGGFFPHGHIWGRVPMAQPEGITEAHQRVIAGIPDTPTPDKP